MKSNIYVIENTVPSEVCDEFNTVILDKVKPEEAQVGTSEDMKTIKDRRSSTVRWVKQEHQELWLKSFDLLKNFLIPVNRMIFDVDISGGIFDIQHTEYQVNNHYKSWHSDTPFNPDSNASQRKLSISIQLSDPNDYEGGDLEFADGNLTDMPREKLRGKGTVIIFPSFITHRVTPVTKGVRHSLVSWCEGSAWR